MNCEVHKAKHTKFIVWFSVSGVSNKIVHLKHEEAHGISMFTTVMRELVRG